MGRLCLFMRCRRLREVGDSQAALGGHLKDGRQLSVAMYSGQLRLVRAKWARFSSPFFWWKLCCLCVGSTPYALFCGAFYFSFSFLPNHNFCFVVTTLLALAFRNSYHSNDATDRRAEHTDRFLYVLIIMDSHSEGAVLNCSHPNPKVKQSSTRELLFFHKHQKTWHKN